ncbi:MAG TPA: c-type cytochrome [Afifellaceae bacterium]|nr:c-type cytochrome [Afifellaceae bacterium]
MDSFEFNKIAGAILGTAVFIMLAGWLTETIFHTEAPETPVYLASLATEEGGEGGMAGGEPKPEESIAMLMASADAGKGESVAKKCAACHTFENGGANKVGPNLWNIVNKTIATVDGYGYSDALKEFADGGKVWDYETLDHFIAKPKALVTGTKMGFGGLSKATDRADLIAYLRSLSDSPAPLPEAPAAGDSADAGGATETASAETMRDTATDAADSSGGAAMTEQPAAAAEGGSDTAMTEQPAEPAQGGSDTAMTEQPAEPAADESPASGSESTEMAAAGSDTPAASSGSGDNPVLAMIASEDPADGEKVAKKCAACHTFEEGGKNKVGPALWNIVNRPVASVDGYSYSDAMKAHAEGGTVWSYEELEAYLAKPKEHVPGTKMVFAGLRKEGDRAALLAYLRTLSGEPAPLP